MVSHKDVKIYNGKRYFLRGTAYNKVDAELLIKDARKNGYKVRLSKRTGKSFGYGHEPKYGIYMRK